MMPPLRTGPRGDLALLIVRLCLGAAFIVHGLPKIQHPITWLPGMLPAFPAWFGALSAFAEFGGGIAMLAGLATPLFAFLIACDMTVALFFVHLPSGASFVGNGPRGSFELPLAYLAMALALLLMGGGAYSIDGARETTRGRPARRR